MNTVADLGGTMGFGPVVPEPEGHPFHAAWQARVLAMTIASGATGTWTTDESRHTRESLPPVRYLSLSYYEIWLAALEKLLVAHGMVGVDELAEGRTLRPAAPIGRVLHAADVPTMLARGKPVDRPATAPARFAPGDRVRTRNSHPRGHTRLPRYARGRCGVVERVHGVHVFPDRNAHGRGEGPGWLYAVRFTARELWGDDADPTQTVTIDAWEAYLTLGDT